MSITPQALEFLAVAKEAFNTDKKLATFKKDEFIALRTGMFEDCIRIYELGNEIGNFVQQLERTNIEYIDKEEYDRLKRIEEESKKPKTEKLIMSQDCEILYNIEDNILNIEVFENHAMLMDFLSDEGFDGKWNRVSGVHISIHRKPRMYL